MKILITSGGTIEPIDSVRSIANTSTGMLGSLIARAFGENAATEKIYYVAGKKAVLPTLSEPNKLVVLPVLTVADLDEAVRKILAENTVDIIIHSMAVSDYRVKAVATAESLAPELTDGQKRRTEDGATPEEGLYNTLISHHNSIIPQDGKLPSNIDNLILFMERTPKIITLFQSLAPKAILVGFKLLDGVPFETLIENALHIMKENKCAFVLANDLKGITDTGHIGYLVDESKRIIRLETKNQIAQAILEAVLEKKGGKP